MDQPTCIHKRKATTTTIIITTTTTCTTTTIINTISFIAMTHISDHGDIGESTEDGIPGSDVLGFERQRPSEEFNRLVGVQAYFYYVVDESEERGEWKSGHEQRHETKLNDYKKTEERPLRQRQRSRKRA